MTLSQNPLGQRASILTDILKSQRALLLQTSVSKFLRKHLHMRSPWTDVGFSLIRNTSLIIFLPIYSCKCLRLVVGGDLCQWIRSFSCVLSHQNWMDQVIIFLGSNNMMKSGPLRWMRLLHLNIREDPPNSSYSWQDKDNPLKETLDFL